MTEQHTAASSSIDLKITEELRDKEFREQFFRSNLEIDIPEQVRTLRSFRKLNQAQLAELCGMKQSAISRLERSEDAKWKFDTLLRLAEALDAELTVTLRPYEDVIARYQREERGSRASAAYNYVDPSQKGLLESPCVSTLTAKSNANLEVRSLMKDTTHGISVD